MMIWLILVFLLGVGCHLQTPATVQQPQPLSHYPLLSPASYGRTVEAEQLIEARVKDQHFQVRVFLDIGREHLLVLGVTALQTRAFMIRYDGSTIDFENWTGHDLPFPAAMILADIQQVLWPELPSREGWRVVDNVTAQERLVFFGDHLATRIEYNGRSPLMGDAVLSNLTYGYQLRIHTVMVQP